MNECPAYETVTVGLGERQYPIYIGSDLLAHTGDLIAEETGAQRAIIITDNNVALQYLDVVENSIKNAGLACQAFTLPAGEGSKSFAQLESLCEDILATRIDRKTLLVALGGGVIGDLTGFVASILLRGIPFVQLPTTLLAQVDSSVGGKTAINSQHGKNLIGSFYQPRLVIADMETLDSLPEREIQAGYAEVVKYGAIRDADFFAWCEANGTALIEGNHQARAEAVAKCCAHKAEIVAADETEQGQRALLNLGHTFGHALEKAVGYDTRLLHGEAVAIGMVQAFRLSERLDYCVHEDVQRLITHLHETGLPTDYTYIPGLDDPGALVGHMYSDKKAVHGRLNFILVKGIGEAFIAEDIDPETVQLILEETTG